VCHRAGLGVFTPHHDAAFDTRKTGKEPGRLEDIANQGESGVTQHDGGNARADGSLDSNFETSIAQQMSATAGGYTIAADGNCS
jgi:hypothetical protein